MNFIRHNLGYKLMALFLSLGLWAYVQLQQGEQPRTFTDTVEVRNIENGLIPRLARNQVRVTVSGPTSRLENISADDVKTWVDLSDLKAGRNRVSVRCEIVQDTGALTCIPQPSVLAVDLEPRVTRSVPIKVLVTGTPPLGYTFAKPQATPSAAVVSGREKDVAQVKQLVASVTTNNGEIGRGVDQNARVLPLDGAGSPVPNVEVRPSEVRIVAPIRIEPASKRLLVSPIPEGRPAEGYKVTAMVPRPREVIARGEATALANLTGAYTQPIPLEGMTGTHTLRSVQLEPISGIEFEPETVSVRIELQPIQGPPSRTPAESPAFTPSPPAVQQPAPTPSPNAEVTP